MKEKATMSVPEAAKFLGISRSLAYRLVEVGQIHSVRLGAKRIVIPRDAVEQIISAAKSVS